MTNKKKIILIVSVISMIIVSFMGGQSFSKYVSQIKGEGEVQIAKWKFLVNGNENFIETINLLSTYNNDTLSNYKIAPGTKGKFCIEIDATGAEVGIQYDVKFEEKSSKPHNLVFIYQEKTYQTLKELETALTGTILAKEEQKIITIPIDWEWKYETGNNAEEIFTKDMQDTIDGKMIENYTFDMIITGTQLAPSM